MCELMRFDANAIRGGKTRRDTFFSDLYTASCTIHERT